MNYIVPMYLMRAGWERIMSSWIVTMAIDEAKWALLLAFLKAIFLTNAY